MIRAEDAAETISPFDKIHGRIGNFAIDQPVAQPLMISFQVIVFGVLFDCQSKMTLADWNDSREAFFLNRSNETLGICVQIRLAIVP